MTSVGEAIEQRKSLETRILTEKVRMLGYSTSAGDNCECDGRERDARGERVRRRRRKRQRQRGMELRKEGNFFYWRIDQLTEANPAII